MAKDDIQWYNLIGKGHCLVKGAPPESYNNILFKIIKRVPNSEMVIVESKDGTTQFSVVEKIHLYKKENRGRISKYLDYSPEEWKAKIQAYMDSCQDTEVQVGESNKGWPLMKKIVNIPSVEGLACDLELTKETIYIYAEDKKDELKKKIFSDAIRAIKREQAKRLMNKGLSGEYNPLIAKLLLSANHGMAEKQSVDHTSKGEKLTMVGLLGTLELEK